ncbi:hypothetical protein [Rhizobium paknamense]|uniref:Uncharacterized protein n=1 Tax=Rhizobium paknamense TaxID=1206817 RepID=A0ABU0IHF6_9HYPH|nr:hypothetical protein [Rhizobium paknamense]MDQ0456654.1 hypothetical protein [Rhizobium paknamense]
MTTFYAWVNPAFFNGNPLDHTWITTYDNRSQTLPTIDSVIAAGQNYWYCWGDFHATGSTDDHPTGLLATADGDLAIAQCLVKVNELGSLTNTPPNGTIQVYGVNGVCHQIANQVLYATKTADKAPLTVKGAGGYAASTFIYGTYGTRTTAWKAKIKACGALPLAEDEAMPDLPDDFAEHSRLVLADQPEKHEKLMELRESVLAFVAQELPGSGTPTAAFINARNQFLLEMAAEVLGAEDFEKVFGFPPQTRIDFVSETQLRRE